MHGCRQKYTTFNCNRAKRECQGVNIHDKATEKHTTTCVTELLKHAKTTQNRYTIVELTDLLHLLEQVAVFFLQFFHPVI